MKIANRIFQKRFITKRTQNAFSATYKGKRFCITTDHGFGKARFPQETRFLIDVVDIKTGWKDVDAYQDFENIYEAIAYALEGAGFPIDEDKINF